MLLHAIQKRATSRALCHLKTLACLAHTQAQPNHANSNQNFTTAPRASPNHYRNLYPWNTEVELAKLLISQIVYNDRGLIAINKPYGLPIHPPQALGNEKTKAKGHLLRNLQSELYGDPSFSVSEAIDYMAQLLNINRLHIAKAAHRDWSGVMLLASSERILPQVEKAIRRAKASTTPYFRFYCITSGITSSANGSERCGIRLFELDELANHKEPIYLPPEQLTKNMIKHGSREGVFKEGPVRPVTVRYRTLASNRQLAVSLVELETTVTMWNFVQCFLAYKASFVLGDTFFAHRVRHIFGQPVMFHPKKVKTVSEIRASDHGPEPLSFAIQKALGVQKNSQLPLMIHCAGITFPGLLNSILHIKGCSPKPASEGALQTTDTKSGDLIVRAEQLPQHFVYTLDQLGLNIFATEQHNVNEKID